MTSPLRTVLAGAGRQLLVAVIVLGLAAAAFILLSLAAYGSVRWGF